MHPINYESLCKALDTGSQVNFIQSDEYVTVTLKNYGKGLSQILHQNASNTFTVKGPLGIPLNI